MTAERQQNFNLVQRNCRLPIECYVNIKYVFHRAENDVYQHFLLFPQRFQKVYSPGVSQHLVLW